MKPLGLFLMFLASHFVAYICGVWRTRWLIEREGM
jgi:hypothetical protein